MWWILPISCREIRIASWRLTEPMPMSKHARRIHAKVFHDSWLIFYSDVHGLWDTALLVGGELLMGLPPCWRRARLHFYSKIFWWWSNLPPPSANKCDASAFGRITRWSTPREQYAEETSCALFTAGSCQPTKTVIGSGLVLVSHSRVCGPSSYLLRCVRRD